jgi:hypothetical protein
MVSIVRFAARCAVLFGFLLYMVALGWAMWDRDRTPVARALAWMAAYLIPVGWTSWLTARLFLQRTGWRVPLWSNRFLYQFAGVNIWAFLHTLLLVVVGGVLGANKVPHPYVALLVIGIIPPAAVEYWFSRKEQFVRGRLLRPWWQAALDLDWLRAEDDPGLTWGGLKVPTPTATLHFAVIGATGSGKSLVQQLLKQDVIPTITPGSGRRALSYDAQGGELARLAGMLPGVPVKSLNALDDRGVAWNIAADCTTPAVALSIAPILVVGENEGPNSYFTKAAQHILSGVLIALMRRAPGVYTFRDVLLIAMSKDLLVQVLGSVDETRDRLEHLKEERTAQSVLSTLVVKLAEFAPVAAAWDNAAERVSLTEWVETGESILVLGNDETARAPLDAINRVLFRRVVELVLARPESAVPQTWFFLDEVREAGRLDNLSSLLTRGRSKGAVAVLGFQDIEGLRTVYGDKEANELVGQCAHKALLRMESPATAAWGGEVVGQVEWVEEKESVSGSVRSVTYERVKREGVLPAEFLSTPPTNPVNGLTGIFLAPEAGAFRNTIPGKELAKALKPADPSVPNFVPRPAWQQILRPWSDADAVRLGLKPGGLPVPAAPTAPPTTAPEPKSRLQVVGRTEPQLN